MSRSRASTPWSWAWSALDERLRAVNARALDLTEALLLLSRTDQRSFTREHVDLSLIAEEATETLLPLAEKRGVTIETSGDITPTVGSHALLLQMTTNFLHNAIVHNLPEYGTVQLSTAIGPRRARQPAGGRARGVAGPAALDADQSRGRRRRQRRHRPLRGADRPGHPRGNAGLRVAIISAITLGITVSRHLIRSDELAAADPAQVIQLLRPCVLSLAARPHHSGPPD